MICLASALPLAAAGPYERYQIASETTCIGAEDKAFEAKDAWSDGGFNSESRSAFNRALLNAAEDAQGLGRGAPSPVVLISHGPPRQEGRAALDVTEEGHNIGDPELTAAIAQAKIPFGIFGHILESGDRATDLEGKKAIRPGQAVPALDLNPGPAFADPWNLNSGGVSHGMAAILTIKNGKGEW
jgi:hypothetical protein